MPIIIARISLIVAVLAILFGSAGRFDLIRLWAYVAVLLVVDLVGELLVDPELIRERFHPGPGERDRLTRVLAAPIVGSHWLLAGLDAGRMHWSDAVPCVLGAAGWTGLVASAGLVIWAARVNPFFSSAVRIQTDRGQRLIQSGPYDIVRHPGYTAAIAGMVSSGLALGSWMSLVPVVVATVLILRRTVLEDRMLQNELVGYAEYAARVRSRLVPGVW